MAERIVDVLEVIEVEDMPVVLMKPTRSLSVMVRLRVRNVKPTSRSFQ